MTGNGIVQFVLNRAEKLRRFLSGRYIVSRHGKNILDAQVHAPFAGTNVPNTLEQFIKVVRQRCCSRNRRILQAFVINGKPLDHVFLQTLGRPYAKLSAPYAIYPVTDGNDHVEVVEDDRTFHLSFPLQSNCKEFLYSSILLKLTFLQDIRNMLSDVLFTCLKQLGHHLLGHPQRLIMDAKIQTDVAIRSIQ